VIAVAAAAAAAVAIALAAAVWSNRRLVGWLPDDPPRPGRKQHARPVPLAGIVLVVAALPFVAWLGSPWATAGFALAAATGYVDDRGKEHGRDLDWRLKALGLSLAAALAATASVDPWQAPATWLLACGFVFVLTNATNFLDNTDGVASGVAAASLLLLAPNDPAAAALGAAALAFLPWNWPRPMVFLGDCGAYALGLGTAVAVVSRWSSQPSATWCVAVQLVDFVQVVVARVWLAVPPWVGDRRHLTHIAQNLGLPRRLVAPAFVLLAVALGSLHARWPFGGAAG
jgi:UDP-GlcNAc:undecaprenyl-phosphate GlcNAc-1-phosphate transferase